MNDDGTMSRLPELVNFSNKHNISIGTVTDLIAYRLKNNTIVERVSETNFHDYFMVIINY